MTTVVETAKAPDKPVAKPAAKAPASKPAKKAAPKAAKPKGNRRKLDGKITVVAKENPWREGTKGAKNFAKYRTGMTVEALIKANVPLRHIRRSKARGAIKIA